MSLIMQKKPLVTHAAAVFPASSSLIEKYTLESRFSDDENDATYPLYLQQGNELWIPRNLAPISDKDEREVGLSVNFANNFKPRNEEQERVVPEVCALMDLGVSHVCQAPTGFGKCLGPNTPVLLFSGRVIPAKDIKVDDLLMGPDSKPRTVLHVNTGKGPMFRIIPNKGPAWECNDAHILPLVNTLTGNHVEVTVAEWLTWSNTRKHCHKLWRTAVNFDKDVMLPLDPYFIGVLLGDGGMTTGVNVTTMDPEIVEELKLQASKWGCDLKRQEQAGNRSVTYRFTSKGKTNNLLTYVRWFGFHQGKYIPEMYRTSSRADRLQLLAGLLDTDGCLVKQSVFEFVSKSETLAEQTCFVARSLGFAAYLRSVEKGCQTGAVGTYYRVHISGDTHVIPTRLPRKQAKVRTSKKSVLRVGFDIEPLGVGEYYGVVIDSDRLFLLGDFTVTHNTFVGCAVAAHVGRRTLVITTKEDLIEHWVGAAKAVLGLDASQIGVWRGDQCPHPKTPFVVSLVQSALKGPSRYGEQAYRGYGLVIADEVHRMGADQFSQAMWWLPARLRLGLSATPYRKDGKEIVFQSHIGNVQVIANQESMVPNVIMKKTEWRVPRKLEKKKGQLKPKLVQIAHSAGRTMHLMKSMEHDKKRNVLIAKFVRLAYEKGRTTIVFSETIGHLRAMRAEVLASGVPVKDTGWYVGLDSEVYEGPAASRKKQREQAKVKRVVFATYKMCSEGTDIPWLDTCVLGAPRSDVNQIVGRIRREYPNKNTPLVFDPVDSDSPVFAGYARQRRDWYLSLKAKVNFYR